MTEQTILVFLLGFIYILAPIMTKNFLLNEPWSSSFSIKGLARCIPLVFSLISATWFVAFLFDLHLLGYDRTWSLYAALHGSVLGWLFVGCLAHLSQRDHVYLVSCYLSLVLFLCVAFGINGIPYIKQIGVIGFSILVPFCIGRFLFHLKKRDRPSSILAGVSFFSIVLSMSLAVLNEFYWGFPKTLFGMSFMTLTHGLLNALITVPCFYFAIRYENTVSK